MVDVTHDPETDLVTVEIPRWEAELLADFLDSHLPHNDRGRNLSKSIKEALPGGEIFGMTVRRVPGVPKDAFILDAGTPPPPPSPSGTSETVEAGGEPSVPLRCWLGHKWDDRPGDNWQCSRCEQYKAPCDNCGMVHDPRSFLTICTVTKEL